MTNDYRMDIYYQPIKALKYIKVDIKIKKPLDPTIKFNLKNNLLNFKKIQKILYCDLDYYQFIRTDHPNYLKIKELYGFLII